MTEARLRETVGNLVQEQVAEFQGLRVSLIGMVEKMTEMSSHFDQRVAAAETQISERQASVTSETRHCASF